VLLNALIVWGEEALSRLNGMWALTLVDTLKGEVLIARDRFGVKPLYFFAEGGTLWLASEIKAILGATGRRFKVDPTVVQAYLRQGLLDTTTTTFFQGVRAFPPGHVARVSVSDAAEGRIEARRFWKISPNGHCRMSPEESIEAARKIFIDAVKLRLRSDVPVGVLLSGGIDSSSIAAAVHELNPEREDIRLISAVGNGGPDEQPFIDAVGRHLRRPIEKVVLDYPAEDTFSLVSKAVWFNDEPIQGFSSIAHYLLMERARQLGVTVLLSGQGADECLCGYKKYLGFYLHDLVRHGRLARATRVIGGFVSQRTVIPQFSYRHSKYYLPRWMRNGEIDIRGPRLQMANHWIPVGLGDLGLADRQVLDIERLSVPALVHYEDRMSMAWSREIRLPFLDYRLVQLLVSLPVEYKLRNGWTKWVFRRAMEPLLPQTIAWRKDKQGFLVQQIQWLRTRLRGPMNDILAEPWVSQDLGLVDRSAVKQRYEQYLGEPESGGTLSVDDVFMPVIFELWARRFAAHLEQ